MWLNIFQQLVQKFGEDLTVNSTFNIETVISCFFKARWLIKHLPEAGHLMTHSSRLFKYNFSLLLKFIIEEENGIKKLHHFSFFLSNRNSVWKSTIILKM